MASMEKVVGRTTKICELHHSLKHILRLCRWIGFFPVEGLSDPYPWRLRFNLKSFYSIYYFGTLLTISITMVTYYKILILSWSEGMTFKKMSTFVMCTSHAAIITLLYRLAKKWPKLIQIATNFEQNLVDIKTSTRVHVRTAVMTYAIIVLAFVEHILFINFSLTLHTVCAGQTEISVQIIKEFLANQYLPIYQILPHSIWFVPLGEIIGTQLIIAWNLADVMGICVSMYLTSLFRDLGKVINEKKSKNWAILRARYSSVVVIVNLISDQLAPFILVSSFTNLFFICLHMFYSLHITAWKHRLCGSLANNHGFKIDNSVIGPAYLMYFVYSLLFLLSRAMLLAHWAANVHTSAHDVVLALYEVPAAEYDQEVECFQMQLRYTKIGLGGVFFLVQRTTILRVISFIITYELVLLQFSFQENVVYGPP